MAKTPNYTAEQTKALVEAFTAADTDEARQAVVKSYAAKFGKNVRSIVAKLAVEKVYIKPDTSSEAKRGGTTKDAVAGAIGAVLQMSDAEVESLAKANRTALDKVWSFMRAQSGEVGADSSNG